MLPLAWTPAWLGNHRTQAVCRDNDSLRPLFVAALQMLYQIDLLEAPKIIAWHTDRRWKSGTHSKAELALHADVGVCVCVWRRWSLWVWRWPVFVCVAGGLCLCVVVVESGWVWW